MSWNYRVAVERTEDEPRYTIREVYYRDGKVAGWTDAASPFGETLEGLADDLQKMVAALQDPTLDLTDEKNPVVATETNTEPSQEASA